MTGPSIQGWPRGSLSAGPNRDENVLGAAENSNLHTASHSKLALHSSTESRGSQSTSVAIDRIAFGSSEPSVALAGPLQVFPAVNEFPSIVEAVRSLSAVLPARTAVARSHVEAVGDVVGTIARSLRDLAKMDRRIARAVVDGTACDAERFAAASNPASEANGKQSNLDSLGVQTDGSLDWTQNAAAKFALQCLEAGKALGRARTSLTADSSGETKRGFDAQLAPDDEEKAGLRPARLPDVIILRAA